MGVTGVVCELTGVFDIAYEVADLLGDFGAQFEDGIDGCMYFHFELGKFSSDLEWFFDVDITSNGNIAKHFDFVDFGATKPAYHDAVVAIGSRQPPDLFDTGDGANRHQFGLVAVVVRRADGEDDAAVVLFAGFGSRHKFIIERDTNHRKGQYHGCIEANQW